PIRPLQINLLQWWLDIHLHPYKQRMTQVLGKHITTTLQASIVSRKIEQKLFSEEMYSPVQEKATNKRFEQQVTGFCGR
ncbi:hypothetical protein NPIL_46011, partial [Nephila pilipes]